MERVPLPPLHPMNEVDSIYVIASRLSTNGKGALTKANELMAAEPDRKVFYHEVTSTNKRANRDHLYERMDKGHDEGYCKPLILGAGGDGTVHYLGKSMLHPDAPKHVTEALLTPWGLGHENDIFASLHSNRLKGSPEILRHPDGREIADFPLEVNMTIDGIHVVDTSLAYITLGPSADGAAAMATEKYRELRKRFPRWMHTLIDVGRGAPIVLCEPDVALTVPTPTEPQRAITEASFNNAERMGGMGNYARSTGLGDHAMHYAELRSNHPLAVAAYVTRIALGFPPGVRTTDAVSLEFGKGSLHGQIEGEPIRDMSGELGEITAITVKPGDKPIRYYATKKPRRQRA